MTVNVPSVCAVTLIQKAGPLWAGGGGVLGPGCGAAIGATGMSADGASSVTLVEAGEERAHREGGRPVLGSGWDESTWPESRPPSATELDRASYGGVVYLARADAHSAVVSSALLASLPADGRRSDAAVASPDQAG